jgi:hypothetical protein
MIKLHLRRTAAALLAAAAVVCAMPAVSAQRPRFGAGGDERRGPSLGTPAPLPPEMQRGVGRGRGRGPLEPSFRALRPSERRGARQEPAVARGYDDGYARGLADGRRRDRYDPVGHSDYRSGDPGYSRDYGSRDAYRNNYRAGFRQGYDEGYRDASRGRR